METERINTIEELHKYNEHIILDVSWGQFATGDGDRTDRNKTIFRGREANSGFLRTIQSNNKIIHTPCTSLVLYGNKYNGEETTDVRLNGG